MVLFVLRRYAPFSGSTSGRDACLWFCQKVLAQTNLHILPIALAVFAVGQYVHKHPELKDKLDELTTVLEDKTKTELRSFRLSHYSHHFNVNEGLGRLSIGRYIFLPVNALVSLALITTNNYKKNRDYIKQSVLLYQQNISANKGYVSPDSQRKSTIDHFWITLLMKEFLTLSPLGAWKR